MLQEAAIEMGMLHVQSPSPPEECERGERPLSGVCVNVMQSLLNAFPVLGESAEILFFL